MRASLEPQVIGIDETAVFGIEVEGVGFSSLRFHPNFELDNLEIVGGPSKYEDLRWVNGSFSRKFKLSWQVRPLGLGEAGARTISVELNDEVLQLPPQTIRVQREPTRPAQRPLGFGEEDPFERFFGRMPNILRPEPREPDVFLRAKVEPQRPVVGQQVLYTVYLYTREDISSLSPSGVPTFRGFWVHDVQLPQQLPTELIEIDGRRYGRVPLLHKALFPLRRGQYKVEPAAIDLTVQRYDRRFFIGRPMARSEHLKLRTDVLWIDVQPLPPAPAGFGGAVGRLALAADLEPRQIQLGEAATLTVRLSGAGNLQGIREPIIAPPPGVTVYPPQQESRDQISGTTVQGSRIWRYVVVANRAGRYTLATPDITYFDPAAQRYRVAAVPDLTLTALPTAAAATEGAASPGAHAAKPASEGLFGQPWRTLLPWLVILPLSLTLIVALARRRAGASHPAAALLREAAAEEKPRQAAARIEEAWRGLLAERWDVPAAAPPSRWAELLAARGADRDSVKEMSRLAEDLQYLRSAPQLSATDTLRAETLERCRRLVRRLK